MEELLAGCEGVVRAGQDLRAIRAVQVLGSIGIPEVRSVLEDMAKGAPEARLRCEAKAALERLARRAAASP